ncbi:SDR family oxidoreductase [Shivajiella indica]|uniref:SDR family oxidoreductase n=1 Tax=Shivajiella indica TaxID=872115 RepID=A0ABW5BCL7_9BACT
MNILIIGATGQLGYTIAKKLTEKNHSYQVIAGYRKTSSIEELQKLKNIHFREVDLTDPKTIEKGLIGIDTIICTANSAVPTNRHDNFKSVDEKGVKSLIDLSVKEGVKQFIYVSAAKFAKWDNKVPLTKAKRYVEKHLINSSLNYTIFQPTAFMEIYFPYMGTDITLKNSPINTIQRPFKFANNFYEGIKNSMKDNNTINIVGNGKHRVSFISLENVADFCVNAINNTMANRQVIPIGGPEALSPLEVKKIFEKVYNKSLKVKSTPPFVMKILSWILGPFNKAASNIMAMNYVMATSDSVIPDMRKKADQFEVDLISAEKFLMNQSKP